MALFNTSAAITAILLSASVAHGAPPPVEAFARRPAMIDVDINPAGTRLAWIEDTGSAARLIIHDLKAKQDLRAVTAPASLRLHRVQWANDDTVLMRESKTDWIGPNRRDTFELWRWVAIDAGGGPERILLQGKGSGDRQLVDGATMVRHNTSHPGKVFMATLDFSEAGYRQGTGTRLVGGIKDDGWSSYLFEVDLPTGEGRPIAVGSPFTIDWVSDASGERIVRGDLNSKLDQFDILVKDGAAWKRIYRAKGCGRLDLLGFSPDGASVLASGRPCDAERMQMLALALDGSAATPIVDDGGRHMQTYFKDPLDERILGVSFGRGADMKRWLDPQAEKRHAALHRTFAGSSVELIARSASYRQVVVRTESAESAPIYYVVDYDAKSADIINEEYPGLSGFKLASVRVFDYEARDKYALFAYLTVPAGAAEKNLPLVALPHGGPEARDQGGFDWLPQFLASRGYAVLQPQFRGSTGLGRAHADAGRRQWGLRMQDDVTDAVRAAINAGIADPKRICIVGWSYGGYAALAGAAFTPELYACSASIAGISDLPAMLGYIGVNQNKEGVGVAYWKDHIGTANDPQVVAKSPARVVEGIRAPILLLHGTDDTVVPIAQSKIMARALAEAKKPYELVELPGDDHALNASVTRVKMARELERFLGTHLASTAPPPATN
jgi:dipeptidyl aminopeptidase/acylaminoacyl peptidase